MKDGCGGAGLVTWGSGWVVAGELGLRLFALERLTEYLRAGRACFVLYM